MFLSRKHKQTRRFGLTFGSSQLTLVQLQASGASNQISHFLQHPWTADQGQQLLQELLSKAKITTRKVAVALPDHLCISKLLLFDSNCTEQQIEHLLRTNLENYLSLPATAVAFDFMQLGLHAADHALQEVRLFATHQIALTRLEKLLTTANLELDVVEFYSHALTRAVCQLVPRSSTALAVLSLMEHLTLTVIVDAVPMLSHQQIVIHPITAKTIITALHQIGQWLQQTYADLQLQQVILLDRELCDPLLQQMAMTTFSCTCSFVTDLESVISHQTFTQLPIDSSEFLISYGLALHPF